MDKIIIVGNSNEYWNALRLGWPRESILRTSIAHLEGRRYKTIHITWEALLIMKDAYAFMDRLQRDQIMMNTKITIGYIPEASDA